MKTTNYINVNQTTRRGLMLGSTTLACLAISCFTLAEIKQNDPEVRGLEVEEQLFEGRKIDELPISDLVNLLYDNSYKVRELAQKKIWAKGKSAIPFLEEAVATDNPELAARSGVILRNIRIGISVDTPEHIVKMIKRFQVEGLDEKEDILQDLYREKQYNQMLFMLSDMQDKEQSARLHERFGLLGYLAARESLTENNIDGAIELLNMVPQNAMTMKSKAFILARSGKLDREIKKEKSLGMRQSSDSWLTAMMVEKDDRPELRKYATKHDLKDLLATLDLLDGEIEGFSEQLTKLAVGDNKTLGLDLLKLIYDGGDRKEIEGMQNQLYKLAETNRAGSDSSALKALYQTGANKKADEILAKYYWNKAFEYLNAKEMPTEALAALKITDTASLEKWGADLRKNILDINAKRQPWDGRNIGNYIDETQLLFAVAELYHSHGAFKESSSLISPLFAEMYKTQNDRWFNTLTELINHNLNELVIEIVLSQANDEDIEKSVGVLYDDTEQIRYVWSMLQKRGKKSVKDNFQDMAYLMGLMRSANNESDAIMAELMQTAEASGDKAILMMNQGLFAVTDFKEDSVNGVKFIEYLLDHATKAGDKDLRRSYMQDRLALASMNFNWLKIDEIISEDMSLIDSSSEWLTRYSIALRKLGKLDKADRILDRAILLTVGLESELGDIASELNIVEDSERSHKLFEKILISNASQPSYRAYIYALINLSNSNGYYVKTEQWGKAASTSYAFAAIDLATGESRQMDSQQVGLAVNTNFNMQFARGMEMHRKGNHTFARQLLQNAHETYLGNGSLADYYYPAFKKTQYDSEYREWVEKSNQHLLKVIKDFPNAANTRNTLAWILGKAVYKMDEGLEHSRKSLELAANEAAYLDTMGELWFAKGDREKAIKWATKAVDFSKRGILLGKSSKGLARSRTYSLMSQLERFKSSPLPSK